MDLIKNKGFIIGLGIGLIGWEYGAYSHNSNLKPSIFLNQFGNCLKNIFSHTGSGLAKINNCLSGLQSIPLKPGVDLLKSLQNVITSPKYLLIKYLEETNIKSINTMIFLVSILLSIIGRPYLCLFYEQFRRKVIPIIY